MIPIYLPDASGWIDEPRVRGHIERLAPGTPVFLNIEGQHGGGAWATYTGDSMGNVTFREEGMALRLRLLAWIRKVRPDLRLGYYREPSGHGGLVLKRPEDWREYVQLVAPLLREQDSSIPQFYFYRDPGIWPDGLDDALLWCERQFEALRCYAPGREIWPVVWPVWYDLWRDPGRHPSTAEHRDCCAMPGHVWRAILDYVLPRSDGLFIWRQGGSPWDDDAPWWHVTKEKLRG